MGLKFELLVVCFPFVYNGLRSGLTLEAVDIQQLKNVGGAAERVAVGSGADWGLTLDYISR